MDLTKVPRGWIPTEELLAWMQARKDAGICKAIAPGPPCMEKAIDVYCKAHTTTTESGK